MKPTRFYWKEDSLEKREAQCRDGCFRLFHDVGMAVVLPVNYINGPVWGWVIWSKGKCLGGGFGSKPDSQQDAMDAAEKAIESLERKKAVAQ